jgi:hypothetical protein
MNENIEVVAVAMKNVIDSPETPPAVSSWLLGLLEKLVDADTPNPRFVKGSVIPTGIGEMADEYSEVRNERLRIEKVAAGVKARESEVYNVIMSALDESPDTGASGANYRVQRIEKERQNVKDWPAFWAYVQQHGSFELLQKRLNDKAVREQMEGGEMLPGISIEMVPTLSFRKVDD